MLKKTVTAIAFVLLCGTGFSQKTTVDTSAIAKDELGIDTSINYDELFDELADFLDSLLAPRSYFLASVSMNRGYFNYKRPGLFKIETVAKFSYSPTLGYYHTSGLGITGSAFMINDAGKLNVYQFLINPSFDYLANKKIATGISYTRYFSKDSLPFYVSPLQNELNAYFVYRKSWFKPAVSVNYAWGTRKDFEARLSFIQSLRLRRRLLNFLQQYKEVSDFSATASLSHDFYWLNTLSKKDRIRFTPQLLFTAGTQQYGFNQLTNNTTETRLTRTSLLNTAREFSLENRKKFVPLSVSFSLRPEYSIGKFFIQPQLLFDYYIPAEKENFSTLFSVTAGFEF